MIFISIKQSFMAKIKIGDTPPDFSLPDQNEQTHSLKDYKNKWILLYFYPKDNTPGCTKEACSFRDWWDKLKKLGVVILGVSKDSIKSHINFANKYKLPFPLLSDQNLEVIKKYGAWAKKKMMGREYFGVKRISVLINPQGKVQKIYNNVKPENHAEEVWHDVRQLTSKKTK